jgi:hypothetical protein
MKENGYLRSKLTAWEHEEEKPKETIVNEYLVKQGKC